jgi:hypothetical protein
LPGERSPLAVWGLIADDIGVLSIHGTGTQANEKNETYMWKFPPSPFRPTVSPLV